MATVHLRIGDLVWGKLGRYPPWPGKIVSPPKDLKKPRGKKCHFVKFFGTEDHAWIKVEQLKPYHAHKEEMIKINKGKRFQQAVDAVEDFLKKAKGKEQNSDGKGDSKGKKTPNKPLKILDEDDEDLSALKDPSEKDLADSDPEPSTIERLGAGPGSGFKWESSPASSMEPISKRLKIIEEVNATMFGWSNIGWSSRLLLSRIGFLGLGLMGSGIVSNLLKMGHIVTVWNRTAEKCDLFIQEGARLGRTPAEVASMCDITFSCVSDPKAARDLVLGPSGVLQGIRPGKCYVEMSTVDPETITELSQVITSRGGRFLEAPVAGSQQLSNDGMLVILAAGDRTVYEDCSSCFQAMGKTSFFLGPTVTKPVMTVFLPLPDILQGNFKPDYYLKHIQKDLRLAISMGDMANHPTPMAAAANEVYKRAKALDQSDNDISAVYRAYIH
ncbi:putative oxidoreductase GLYR1 [Neolamprologus brichardi]|uniref:putative oxidoreductase GLYR1 n=1 Tax=Neolamprologus brichardi TaxID=32507 RepID=UPI001643F7C9|nr:putative oxidoreductase GLYR1 [Neolamprologus brichardi]